MGGGGDLISAAVLIRVNTVLRGITITICMRCVVVSNSPNPSSVYIRLCKHRKKVFYCLNIAFLEKYCYFAFSKNAVLI